jgi:hypothetical protein
MFVGIPQKMESPQMSGFVGVPTMVWLKRLHDGDCFLGDAESGFRNFELCIKGILAKDRKANFSSGLSSFEECQIPSQVIQRRTEIADEVASHQPKREKVIFVKSLISDDKPAVYRILVSGDSLMLVGIGTELFDRQIESIKVMLRPYELQIGCQCTLGHSESITAPLRAIKG